MQPKHLIHFSASTLVPGHWQHLCLNTILLCLSFWHKPKFHFSITNGTSLLHGLCYSSFFPKVIWVMWYKTCQGWHTDLYSNCSWPCLLHLTTNSHRHHSLCPLLHYNKNLSFFMPDPSPGSFLQICAGIQHSLRPWGDVWSCRQWS